MRPLVRWPLLAAAVIAAAVLPLILLEGGLRAFHYGYPTEFFVPLEGKAAFASNEKFGWRFFPASMARIPVVSYVPSVKAANAYRIFILGDSAAMGIPEPAFSFGRMLRVMLESRYPGANFEVINTAMTAINSHVMVPIAADSARLSPDLFIVFAGNNEVVGPYGPGTALAGYLPALSLIRAGVWFKSTRIAELMEQGLSRFHKSDTPGEWGGMAMFAGHQVSHDDARLRIVYRNFRANLEAVCRVARDAGAATILSTVPVNLKDSPPFAPEHGDDSHYRLGRSLWDLHREREAHDQFVAARDLDTLRFRADSQIIQTIREVAAEASVPLVDAERQWGTPGNEVFYEHVHLNFAGNFKLAALLLGDVERRLPERIRKYRREAPPLTESQVATALAFTEWDRDKSTMEMLTMMLEPPFPQKADVARRLGELREKWSSPERAAGTREHFAQYLTALQRNPADLDLREILAELESRSGDHLAAAAQYRTMIGYVPSVSRWHANLAHELGEMGQLDEARAEAEAALQTDPQAAPAQFTMGRILERSGQPAEAIDRYQATLRIKPDYAEANLRLAIIYGSQGRYRDAVEQYTAYLKHAPDSAEIESNIGFLLVKLAEVDQAVPHYREALRLRPNFAEAANNLGAALERLGKTDESIAYYRLALQLRPGFAQARDHLEAVLRQRKAEK